MRPAALTKIGELVGSAAPRVALAAAQEIFNRVYGKPLQSVESDVRMLDIGKFYLAAVQADNGKPPTVSIDVTRFPELKAQGMGAARPAGKVRGYETLAGGIRRGKE